MSLNVINPATGKLIKSYEEMTPGEIDNIIGGSHKAFLDWKNTSYADRASLMKKAAQILRNKSNEYAVPLHRGVREFL